MTEFLSEDVALEYLIDAAFIAGSMDSTSVYDHYNASDYLAWAAARYAEALIGKECYP